MRKIFDLGAAGTGNMEELDIFPRGFAAWLRETEDSVALKPAGTCRAKGA